MRSALCAALLLACATGVAGGRDLLVFSAMGCGPYTPEDEAALRFYLERENAASGAARSSFLVHLGDINSGADGRSGKTGEAHYAKIAELLADGNEIPTFVVPVTTSGTTTKTPTRRGAGGASTC